MDELVDEFEQLTDIVGGGGGVWIGPIQVLLVNLVKTLHALVDRLIFTVGPCIWPDIRLEPEDGVSGASSRWGFNGCCATTSGTLPSVGLVGLSPSGVSGDSPGGPSAVAAAMASGTSSSTGKAGMPTSGVVGASTR